MVSENANLLIRNNLGQEVYRQPVESILWNIEQKTISLGNLPAGVYFVTLNSGVSQESVKFVKK